MAGTGEWYVADDGEVSGPLSATELAVLAATRTGPVLVWKDGLEGWSDAREIEALRPALGLAAAAPQLADKAAHKPTVAERARRELIEYGVIAAYLYVCFGALILYKAAILRGAGVPFAPIGFALAKALILGKFLILLHAAKVGEHRTGGGRMLVEIGRKALLFAGLLILLNVIEEVIVGWFHHKPPAAVLAEMTGDSALQVLATAFLMVLVLVPYFAFRAVTERLGEGVLARMLLARAEAEDGRPQPRHARGHHRRDVAGGDAPA
jgi:hypothetical protein